MSSASEHDFSECSNLGSPPLKMDSPYSSPSQQVPHLASAFSGITCDDISMHVDGSQMSQKSKQSIGRIRLHVVEQPQNYFRFRYKSEMVGTHGCLLGRSTSASKTKTHPTVELLNYTGKALIRCRLAQADKDDEHPHKLFEDEQEDRDVSAQVPEQGSYKVGFAGMGIIHTAKKDVPSLLYKKYLERPKNSMNMNTKELRAHCESTAKSINLNIVRLRFSAHDIATDREICPPVFSEPIHNMKSAAVNDLKICRISRYCGRPRGGDDVFILVEKVNKKNILVRFYELDEMGHEVWSANANFLLNDVHHQYAIVFRTPAYKDPNVGKDVKVFIELVRPSDGRTSDPKEFVYKANPMFKNSKRRREDSSFSSFDSSSGGSLKSLGEIPTTVEMMTQNNERIDALVNIPVYQIHIPQASPVAVGPSSELADALYYGSGTPAPMSVAPSLAPSMPASPMLGQPNVPEPPVISLNSTELDRIINLDGMAPSQEFRRLYDMDLNVYMQQPVNESLFDDRMASMEHTGIPILRLKADSGRGSAVNNVKADNKNDNKNNDVAEKKSGYNEFYRAEDGNEVRQLIKEICDLIKSKNGLKKQAVRSKLERIFELRLSNGDTFLHMTLSTNQPSFEFIVKLISTLRMPHLLNLPNDRQRTILHLAVMLDMPNVVPVLISKGCEPMLGDKNGNNAVHYAVMYQNCLQPLLAAIKRYDVHCDLNAYNFEKQTALHLAARDDSEQSARLLLQHGASANARDSEGRSPLHLAVYDDYRGVARALLDHAHPNEIDSTDGRGNTALQIVCGAGLRKNTIELVKLLMEKKADPYRHEPHTLPAWRLAMARPDLREALRPLLPPPEDREEPEVKSEPEDDFESADEGEYQPACLPELSLYVGEVSKLLDDSGAWRPLAAALAQDQLIAWYANTASPTRTLLQHVKESAENPLSSKALAELLQNMCQLEAAAAIQKYISV